MAFTFIIPFMWNEKYIFVTINSRIKCDMQFVCKVAFVQFYHEANLVT